MKSDDQVAAELLRQMGRLVVPLLATEREAGRHERMASAVNRLLWGLRAEPRRRLPLRTLGAFAAAAACLGLLLGARHFGRAPRAAVGGEVARVISVSGESTLWRVGASPRMLVAQQRIAAADELRCPLGSRTQLSLTGAGKARVDVAEDTRVRLGQRVAGPDAMNEDSLDLEQGLLTLQVERLPPGLGLSVQTPDARVTVHGTRFSVRVSPRVASGTVTLVAVTEGRVEVASRGQVMFLGPGEHWSSQNSPSEPETVPLSPLDDHVGRASAVEEQTRRRALAAGIASQSPPPSAAPAEAGRPAATSLIGRPIPVGSTPKNLSTLAEENRLYAESIALAGAGALPRALDGLSTLIRDYPHSPLAQNARVDRFRLLQQTGNESAAAQEARRYLTEYPSGFARAEARRLALSGLEAPK